MATPSRPSTPLEPPSIYHSLSPEAQQAIHDLVRHFEDIDHIVDREFKQPHEVIRNPSRSLQDDNNLGPVSYLEEDKTEFAQLFTVREHEEDEYFLYLGDRRYKKYWRVVFDSLAKTWGRGSIFWPDSAQNKIYNIGNLSRGLDSLASTAVNGTQLPRYVKSGIEDRIRLLDSFLDTCESIMARHDDGSRSSYDTYEVRPRRIMFKWREQETSSIQGRNVVSAYQTQTGGIIAALNHDRSIIGITSIANIVATALSFIAFARSDAWDKRNYSQNDLFNYIQGAILSMLGLGLTVLPLLQERSLGKYASRWVGLLATISGITNVLAPSLYPVIGPAWCNILVFTSSVFQSLISLQLLQALQKADIT